MSQNTGTITLYKGTGKKSGKPFSALMLTAGEWSTLYFVDSKFEMKYLEEYLGEPVEKTVEQELDDVVNSDGSTSSEVHSIKVRNEG